MKDWTKKTHRRLVFRKSKETKLLVAMSPEELGAYDNPRKECISFLRGPWHDAMETAPEEVVVVGYTDDTTSTRRLPHYLRGHWCHNVLTRLSAYVARKGAQVSNLQVVYFAGSPALVDDSYYTGLVDRPRHTVGVAWGTNMKSPAESRQGTIHVNTDQVIETEWGYGVLAVARELCLRELFFRPNEQLTITILEEIKDQKVFRVSVDSPSSHHRYFVKFDTPQMIETEWKNYCDMRSTRREPDDVQTDGLYRIVGRHSIEGDLLGAIASRSSAHDNWVKRKPNTVLGVLKKGNGNSAALQQIADELSRIFELITECGLGNQSEDAKCDRNRKTCEVWFKLFFRGLPGFRREMLLPDDANSRNYIRAHEVDNDEPEQRPGEQWREQGIRRVGIVDESSGHVAVELDPSADSPERVRIEYKLGDDWCVHLEDSRLTHAESVWIRPTNLRPPWGRAAKILHYYAAELTGILAREGLKNPLSFCMDLLEVPDDERPASLNEARDPQADKLRNRAFLSFEHMIHYDLHLNNIIAFFDPSDDDAEEEQLHCELIDLASMRRGPMDYDFVRTEVRLMLDLFVAPREDFEVEGVWRSVKGFYTGELNSLPEDPATCLANQDFDLLLRRIRESRQESFDRVFADRGEGDYTPDEYDPAMYLCRFAEAISELLARSQKKDPADAVVLAAFFYAALAAKDLLTQ